MTNEEIMVYVQKTIERAGTKDPFAIARFYGFKFGYLPEGYKEKSAVTVEENGKKIIWFNRTIEKQYLDFYCAKEFGRWAITMIDSGKDVL